MLQDYLAVIIFMAVGCVVGCLPILLSQLLSKKKPSTAKQAAYECGFDSFEQARSRFDIRFYLVAILFIIFDLEVAFLYPWALSFDALSNSGFWVMLGFLLILTVGFLYEWRKGALEWE